MSQEHRIAEIKSLSAAAKTKLAALGIGTVQELIARAGAGSQRTSLARELGVEVSQVTEWVNRADLMRLVGVGTEYANLLEEAGVDSCKELQHRVPQNLWEKLTETNQARQVTKRTPSLGQVQGWVAEAKTLAAGT